MENYLIVLFEDKVRKKILKKYITFKKAKQYFDKCLSDSNNVIFKKNISNGCEINFEIGLVELSSKQLIPVYITDEIGRNIKVSLENDGMTLISISKYNIEESLYDVQTNSKIDTLDGVKKLTEILQETDGIIFVRNEL
jgi:pyruvate kinase